MLSKRKLGWFLAGALVFVGLGLLMASSPVTFIDNPFLHDPAKIRLFGILAAVFFGVLGFFLFKKLGDSAPGLVATPEGFTDNSSGLAAGPIHWADVAALQELKIMGQPFVLVRLHDPNKYIEQQTNRFKRQLMQTNLTSYGSPIFISANTLQCTPPELYALLTARLTAYRARA